MPPYNFYSPNNPQISNITEIIESIVDCNAWYSHTAEKSNNHFTPITRKWFSRLFLYLKDGEDIELIPNVFTVKRKFIGNQKSLLKSILY